MKKCIKIRCIYYTHSNLRINLNYHRRALTRLDRLKVGNVVIPSRVVGVDVVVVRWSVGISIRIQFIRISIIAFSDTAVASSVTSSVASSVTSPLQHCTSHLGVSIVFTFVSCHYATTFNLPMIFI